MSPVSRKCHCYTGNISENERMTPLDGTDQDQLEQCMAELRRGAVIVLEAKETVIVASVETVHAARYDALHALPSATLALTGRRASVLKMRTYDGDIARIPLPGDRMLAAALADPSDDLDMPLKGPFETQRGGDAAAERLAIKLCKVARLLPAAVIVRIAPDATPAGAIRADAAALERALDAQTLTVERFSDAHVPLSLAEDSRVYGFRPSDGGPDHFAIMVGDPTRSEPVLVRAHSECYTGDQLGSLKCDCGPQLRAALAQISANGSGILLYLAQEGRGIGMANKLRAYALQDQGFDTVDANHRLGFEDDERDFRIASLMLRSLGFDAVKVMTNNPRKLAAFERNGIRVAARVPLAVGRTDQNDAYLKTKAQRSGHLL